MNRNLLFSIVGLGALSAAGFAGSNGQNTSVVASASTLSSAPVVVVTSPDGNRVVAHCINVSTTDSKSRSGGGSNTFTFTAQGQGASVGVAASGTGSCTGATATSSCSKGSSNSSGSGGFVGFGSAAGGGASSTSPHESGCANSGGSVGFGASSSTGATTRASHASGAACTSPASSSSNTPFGVVSSIAVCDPKRGQQPCASAEQVTEAPPAESNGLFARIFSTREARASEPAQAPVAENALVATEVVALEDLPLIAADVLAPLDANELAEELHSVHAEHFVAQARERRSESQERAREVWERAADEARVAQERAREQYEQAIESYRDAMQAALERTHEAQERVIVERRARAEQSAPRAPVNRSNSSNRVQRENDEALVARIERLEAAARGRGVRLEPVDGSLEERVARLEKKMAEEKAVVPLLKGLFTREAAEQDAAKKAMYDLHLRTMVPPSPVAPTPPTGPSAPRPRTFRLKMTPDAPPPPEAPTPRAWQATERADLESAVDELKREAARLRDELGRMRSEVERLPREQGAR